MKRKKDKKGSLSRLGLIVILVMILLTACEGLPFEIILPWAESAPNLSVDVEETPQVDVTSTVEPEPEETLLPSTDPDKLIIWLPPEMDPYAESDSGKILLEKLNSFANSNKVEIIVRIKAQTGAGSLTDSLTATRSAAPEILPDLILLSAPDLDLASRRNLIYANEGLDEFMAGVDWYPFARQMSTIDGEVLAVPLFVDPYAMIYNSASQLPPSNEWNQIHKNFGIFGFAGDDPLGKFLLLQYLAADGKVADGQGYALLEEAPLIEALQVLKDSLNTRHINYLSLGYQNDNQVWQSFLDRNLDTAVVPVSIVLADPRDNSEQPEPAMTEAEFTIGSASAWALANPDTGRQALALELLEELMQTEFLGRWSESLHKLPSKPTALGSWTEPKLKPALEKIAQVVVLFPEEAVLNKLGPILRNATLLILRDGGDVVETARQAIESVK